MENMLVVNPKTCIACGKCELACSLHHTKSLDPRRARIKVASRGEEIGTPVVCLQCDDAACLAVCPVGAIVRDEATEAVRLDQAKCVQCKACLAACPFGNVTWDPEAKRVVKCDLCAGFPMCAVFCPSGALKLRPASTALRPEARPAAGSS